MTFPVTFLRPAEADVRRARDWLEFVWPELGDAFVMDLRKLCDRLAEFPDSAPPFHNNSRRAILRRFDYAVVYRHLPDRVQIVAVLPCRLDPAVAAKAAEERF